MGWIIFIAVIYVGFLLFYREAKPAVHVGVILLLVFVPPILSGFAGIPWIGPKSLGQFLAKVIDYYMEILKSFAQASTGM